MVKEDFLRFGSTGAFHRLVLLHGWGADAEDLIPIGIQLRNGFPESLELLALRAPNPHPDGIGRQWYGLFPPDWSEAFSATTDLTNRLKGLSETDIPLEKTMVLGFSQGGAMALASGSALPLAGIVGCSAYPHPDWEATHLCPPTLLTHGREDEVVPYAASEELMRQLKRSKNKSELVIFDGGHQIPLEIIPTIQQALKKWLF